MTVSAFGFDKTVRLEDDEFGRGQLVRMVYDLLISRDPSWSVRVALNGDWGSGKTSIAEIVSEQAREAGHAVGLLHPWRVTSSKEIATALTETVLSALDDAGVSMSAMNKGRRQVAKGSAWLDKLRGFYKLADIGIGILQNAGEFDNEFATPISEQLRASKKRLLIIIDDLDRCEPAFLPSLLLFMRTALDVPGFSFLCPFDSDIVAKTLTASNKAWTSADRFLEKVFDFRIPIPDLTVEQKQLFLASQLAAESIQVDERTLKAAAAHLPGTPRAIKALARDLGMSRLEYARRRSDEIDWTLLVLASMLRATSLEFFRAFRREIDQDVERAAEASVKALCELVWEVVGRPDVATVRRVDELVKAMMGQSDKDRCELVRRTMHFTDEFEPITWMEFDKALTAAVQNGLDAALRAPPLSPSLAQDSAPFHLASRAVTRYGQTVRVLREMQGRQALVEEYRESLSGQAHLLRFLLALIHRIPTAQGMQRLDIFSRFLAIESEHRREGAAELEAEALEVLRLLCAHSADMWPHYDQRLHSLPLGPDVPSWNIHSAKDLFGTMKDRARRELIERLLGNDGLADVFDERANGNLTLLAQVFLDPFDQFWNEPAVVSAMTESWKPAVGENLRHVFDAIATGIVGGQRVLEFVGSGTAIRFAWRAYVGIEQDCVKRIMRYRHLVSLGDNLSGVRALPPGDTSMKPFFALCEWVSLDEDDEAPFYLQFKIELVNNGADAVQIEAKYISLGPSKEYSDDYRDVSGIAKGRSNRRQIRTAPLDFPLGRLATCRYHSCNAFEPIR